MVEKIQLPLNLFGQDTLSSKSISKDISGSGNNKWRNIGPGRFLAGFTSGISFLWRGWVDEGISKMSKGTETQGSCSHPKSSSECLSQQGTQEAESETAPQTVLPICQPG